METFTTENTGEIIPNSNHSLTHKIQKEKMEEKLTDQEYSLQFFEFTPESLFKEFSETVLAEMAVIVQQGMDAACDAEDDEEKQSLLNKCKTIHDVWSERAAAILPKLETVITDLFTIPKNVLLPSDSINRHQYTEEEIENLEKNVAQLEEEYVELNVEIAKDKKRLKLAQVLGMVIERVVKEARVVEDFKKEAQEVAELNDLIELYKCTKLTVMKDHTDELPDEDYLIHAAKFQ